MPHNPTLAPRPPTRRRRRAAAVQTLLTAALALLSVLALASPASALEQQIGIAGNDAFGASVAIQGDTLVIGTFAQLNHAGTAYVYQRTGDVWNQTAKLVPSDSAIGDGFGIAVAIDGDTIVVGAPGATIANHASQGAVYTFSRTGAPTRTETAKLTVSDGAALDALGHSVAINGDAIVAGDPSVTVGKNAQQGAVYTFTRDGAATRTETATLTASDGVANANLGASVAIEGDTIVAGAPDVSVNATPGAAYTFARTGASARTETAKLTASDGVSGAQLGRSVAIDGDTIVAGATRAVIGGVAKGAVYTFTRSGPSARIENGTLSASDGTATSFLGLSVAIDADTILAGAPGDTVINNPDQGSAYTFARTGLPARRQTGTRQDADGALNDFFGFSVALDSGTTVIGAAGRGVVSVFFSPAPPPPPPPPPPSSSPPPPPPAANPVLSKLAVNPTTIHHNNGSSHSKSSGRGAITFTLSMPATVRLSFAESLTGRMAGNRCTKPARANNGKRHCMRMITVRSLSVRGQGGTNIIRLAGGTLRIGSYRLTATPTSASGGTGTARSTTFRIVK